ncbi:MAG: hypothetical protein IJ411_02470 [Oscillospiraceae bacterium]|nr:hypothetical protein [Oscillospiraceae bacterium]
MELYLLFILVPALLAYVLQAAFFNKVKHKYWKHGSLALVVPPILIGVAAYFLLPNATVELKEMIQVVWTTMSLGVIIGWALAIVMQKINDKVNGGK